MGVKDLSFCFTTNKITICKEFYIKYFGAEVSFDCGWYVVIVLRGGRRKHYISFMEPQNNEPLYTGGITLNLKVKDVDSEYENLQNEGIEILAPIVNNPWGDRSFIVSDPLGNHLYIYSARKPTREYANAYVK